MLSKQARLRALEVKEVLKHGIVARNSATPHLSAKFIKGGSSFRAAVVVPKSVVRGAVARNRVRRAVYRAIKGTSPTNKARIIFFVQRTPPTKLSQPLNEEVAALLKKIN